MIFSEKINPTTFFFDTMINFSGGDRVKLFNRAEFHHFLNPPIGRKSNLPAYQ
jgi:hypothetical protein